MSGLAAVFNRDGRPADEPSLWSMLAAVPYLGLDGSWIGLWGQAGLGYAKTAVTPEEQHERQPLVSPRTGCVVVADARLDNREELLDLLPDHPPATASDSELILRAYEAWGTAAPKRLFGDFAFVVWDPRHQRMVCARDTSGERTLFYRLDERAFAVASEIHQLLQDPSIPIAPNDERVLQFLTPFRVYRNDQEQAATFFRGIHVLPAGHTLVVDCSEGRLERYWNLKPPHEIRYRRNEEYVQHFANILASAVASRLRSSGPVGAMLSGGLDSTSVVCMAQQLYQQGLVERSGFVSFSMVFEGLECDESPFIRDVQAMYGFDARYLPAPEYLNLDPAPGGFLAAPIKCPSEIDVLLGEASRAGVRVVLSGLYGDNCFGAGEQSFDSLLARGRLAALWHHLEGYRRRSDESFGTILAQHTLLPLLPRRLQTALRSTHVRGKFDRERADLIPAWIPSGVADRLLESHLALSIEAERGRRFRGAAREDIFRTLYPTEVIPLARGHSSRVLRPFNDRRLHEFLLAIPPEQLYEPHPYAIDYYAGAKLILRRAMLGILPESVRTRTQKPNFSSVVRSELERHWDTYEAVFGPGGRSEIAARGYIDPPAFWERLERLRAGQFSPDGVYAVRMLNIETWLRSFDLPRPQRVAVQSDWSGSEGPTGATTRQDLTCAGALVGCNGSAPRERT